MNVFASQASRGKACDIHVCPNDCSGHGDCTSTLEIGLENSIVYSNWDKKVSSICRCDWGYAGADCSHRLCPKGDDPETAGQTYKSYKISVASSSGHLGGIIKFFSMATKTTFNAHGSLETSASCKTFLQKLYNIDTVSCEQGTVDTATGGVDYIFNVTSWPVYPWQNNIYHHDGAPPASAFVCDVSRAKSQSGAVSCNVSEPLSMELAILDPVYNSVEVHATLLREFVTVLLGTKAQHARIARTPLLPCADPDVSVKSQCTAHEFI